MSIENAVNKTQKMVQDCKAQAKINKDEIQYLRDEVETLKEKPVVVEKTPFYKEPLVFIGIVYALVEVVKGVL